MAQDTISNIQTSDTEQVTEPFEEVQPAVQAQPEKPAEKPPWKEKIYFGGYVNFSFGSYTSIGIEPMVGYKIIPRLSVGAKIRYDYISDNRYSTTYSSSNYGGSLFTRLSLIKKLYLHAEFAGYNYKIYDEFENSDRDWIPFFFVGGGLNQPLGRRASLNIQLLFDVLHNTNSPYGSWEPFYSVGVSVGF